MTPAEREEGLSLAIPAPALDIEATDEELALECGGELDHIGEGPPPIDPEDLRARLDAACAEGLEANLDRWLDFAGVRPGDVVELAALDVPVRYGKPAIFTARATSSAVVKRLLSPREAPKGAPGLYVLRNLPVPEIAHLNGGADRWIKAGGGDRPSDKHIAACTSIYFDIDPTRPRGLKISATLEERDAAWDRSVDVLRTLLLAGVPFDAVGIGDSGNGTALYVAVDRLEESDALHEARVALCEALHALHGDEAVKIDSTSANAARLHPAYGTPKRKGSDSPERRHRPTGFLALGDVTRGRLSSLEEVQAVVAAVQALVPPAEPKEAPKPARPTARRNAPGGATTSSPSPDSPFVRANAIPIDEVCNRARKLDGGRAVCPGCSRSECTSITGDGNGIKCFSDTCAAAGVTWWSPVDAWAAWHAVEPIAAAYTLLGETRPARRPSVAKVRPAPDAGGGGSLRPNGPEPATAYTDLGNAERFVEQHADDVRHCAKLGGWHVWSGAHWQRDETKAAQRRAQLTVRNLYAEIEAIAAEIRKARTPEEKKALIPMLEAVQKHAKKSEHTSRIAALLHEAAAIPPIPVAFDAFDADRTALLLNTPSGTIDLETGALHPHDRCDLITKCTSVPYDPEATAPRFLAFLEEILPDADVRAFMKRWVGYAATGVIREHVLPIWYGSGANGKGTLAEIFSAVLGDYAIGCPEGFFEEQKHRGHQTEIARLRGARLAIASETERAVNLAESKVKKLTGGDSLTGNFMRQDFFTFRPTCKFVVFTNHKPRIRSTDDGIRRRILLVPFTVRIPPERRNLSLLEELLAEEGPGILRWIVDGARELLAADGRLDPPASIHAATEEYLASEDVVGRFLEEACTCRKPGDALVRSQPSHLGRAFNDWCAANGESACSARELSARLAAHGYTISRSNGKRWYLGLSPLSNQDDPRNPSDSWGES